jgi:hypothetical protein
MRIDPVEGGGAVVEPPPEQPNTTATMAARKMERFVEKAGMRQ